MLQPCSQDRWLSAAPKPKVLRHRTIRRSTFETSAKLLADLGGLQTARPSTGTGGGLLQPEHGLPLPVGALLQLRPVRLSLQLRPDFPAGFDLGQ